MPRIDIAMATYNGASHIGEMLASIAAQDHADFALIVSDDGSSDNTLAIVKSFAERMAIRIVPGAPRKGVLRNFETALAQCDAPYVAFCDQDDYWQPNKLRALLARIEALEAQYSVDTPLLVFSDIEVVDSGLARLKASMFEQSIKSRDARDFADFFFSSHVPGCAMLFNRALIDLALPFPEVEVHDWWMIQLATLFGRVDCVDLPLIKYRQHANNTIGLGNPGKNAWAGRLRKLLRPAGFVGDRMKRWSKQAQAIKRGLIALEQQFGTRLEGTPNGRLIETALHGRSVSKLHALLRHAKVGEWRPDYLALMLILTRGPR